MVVMRMAMSTATVWDRPEWESSPTLCPRVWTLSVAGLGIATVAEDRVGRALFLHVCDKIPEGSGLVVVTD